MSAVSIAQLCGTNDCVQVNGYLLNTNYESVLAAQRSTKLQRLRVVHTALTQQRPRSFADCVAWARLRFEELFSHNIKELLLQHPLDKGVAEGKPFWTAKKRPPTPEVFDFSDPVHRQFIVAAANLWARVWRLNSCHDDAVIAEALKSVIVPPFRPSNKRIAATEEEAKELEQVRLLLRKWFCSERCGRAGSASASGQRRFGHTVRAVDGTAAPCARGRVQCAIAAGGGV